MAHAHLEFNVRNVVFFFGRFITVDKENTPLFDWADDGGNRLAMTTRRL